VILIADPNFINNKVQDLLGKPEAETEVMKVFELGEFYGKFQAQKIEGMSLYSFMESQSDSAYFKRILKELNDKFNLLYV
jgi:hypothetical protein